MSKYKRKNIIFDEIWYLTPCSPLITSKDLINASKFSKKIKTNSLLAISKFSTPIQRAFKLDNNKKISFINKIVMKNRTQDLGDSYYDTGTFGMFKSEIFYRKKNISFSGYVLPKYKGIDINNQEDWDLAKTIFESKYKY